MRVILKDKLGFTIVELLIVVTVIGILAAITIVSYTGITTSARDKSLQNDAEGIASEITRFATTKNAGIYGNDVVWNSEGSSNSNISFNPSEGNLVDVVANKTEFCVRVFNPGSNYKTAANAVSKGSSGAACTLLLPSVAAGGTGGSVVGYWKLNGNTIDESDTGVNGVPFSVTPTTNKSGEQNKAYAFNGTSSYISLGTAENYNYTNFSVSVWAKANSVPPHVRNIIGKGSWSTANDWYIGFKSATHVSFVYGLSSWNVGPSYLLTNYDELGWVHYVGTVSPTQQKLYINGALVSTVNASHGTVVSTYDLQIGRASYAANFFQGSIDDVRVYNAELPTNIISEIYQLGPQ